jgi:pyruvate,water dikinase
MSQQVAVKNEYQTETAPTTKKKTAVRIMRGIGASQGVAMGPCRVISRLEDLKAVKKGEILIYRNASPYLALYMGQLKGLVTEAGGPLSIAAGYAREYEVPHVAGVTDIMAFVTDGQIIRIDGLKGTVSLL